MSWAFRKNAQNIYIYFCGILLGNSGVGEKGDLEDKHIQLEKEAQNINPFAIHGFLDE